MKRSMFAWIGVTAVAALLFGVSLATSVSAQSSEDDPAQVEAGMAVFELNCAGCHGSDGMGTSQGRPLIDVASENDRARHIMTVTDGRTVMPAFGERLSAEEIEAAVSYVRLTFVSEAAEDSADAEPEALADTGTETGLLAVAGLTLISTGALLTHQGRRIRQRMT